MYVDIFCASTLDTLGVRTFVRVCVNEALKLFFLNHKKIQDQTKK